MRAARAAEAAHEGLYGLSRLARDEGCVVRTGSFGIKTEARPKHEGIRLVSNRVLVKEVEGALRHVLVVWVAQKQHEDAALHHDFGGKLHLKTGALSLAPSPNVTILPLYQLRQARCLGYSALVSGAYTPVWRSFHAY